jgi:hypothetical protein
MQKKDRVVGTQNKRRVFSGVHLRKQQSDPDDKIKYTEAVFRASSN